MFVRYIICIISVFALIRGDNDAELNNDILILDENSLFDTIDKNDFVFINFYASWCVHSKNAAPGFQKAAKRASEKKLPVVFAKIESTGKKELFNISGYPTFKLFRRGSPIKYFGDYLSADFIDWIQTHLNEVKILNTLNESKLLIESGPIVIGFFEDKKSDKALKYEEIAIDLNRPLFAITNSTDILDAYNATDESIILFNKWNDDNLTQFSENLTLDNMKNFLNLYSKPLIQEISKISIDTLISEMSANYKYVMIIVSKNDTNKTDSILESAKIVAKEYRKQIKFVLIDVDKDYLSPFVKQYHISLEEIPSLLLIPNIFKTAVYKMNGNLSLKNIKYFIKYFENDKIDDLVNEKLPEDWNKTLVYTLVKTNFINVTHDYKKDVLVYMYVNNCQKCLKWASIIEDVASSLVARKDVIVAKINVGLNTIDEKWYRTVPSIVLFRKNDNRSVYYKGEPNVKDVFRFIQSESVNQEEKFSYI
ncbi:hypothetical protein FQR65_LT08276 [Abscondita terminalis]|nr:hypothetical protein FQR65_LT08276 [Abscondita terminalis]